MTWLMCFAICLVWVVVTAPVLGVVGAMLSGFVLAALWELVRFIRDVIHIWQHPYDDRRFPDSDIHKYL